MLTMWYFLVFVLIQNVITICSALCYEMDLVVCLGHVAHLRLWGNRKFQPMKTDLTLFLSSTLAVGFSWKWVPLFFMWIASHQTELHHSLVCRRLNQLMTSWRCVWRRLSAWWSHCIVVLFFKIQCQWRYLQHLLAVCHFLCVCVWYSWGCWEQRTN